MKLIFVSKSITSWPLLLVAFFIPLYIKVVPVLIGGWGILWLLGGNYRTKWEQWKKSIPGILLTVFYLVHFIGMLWTRNMHAGWFDMEVKLSFLLLPFLMTGSGKDRDKALTWFTAGGITGSLICLLIAAWHFIRTGENHFEYTLLSPHLHPTYFALYICIGILFLMKETLLKPDWRHRFLLLAGIIYLSGFIVLLSSKIGIILLALAILSFAVHLIFQKKALVFGAVLSGLACITMLAVFHFFPYTFERLTNAWNTVAHMGSIDSSLATTDASRILIWKADLHLLQANMITGTGTGDVKDELIRTYQDLGFSGIAARKLNAHNQFLQSWLALGLAGILPLLTLFIILIRHAIQSRNWVETGIWLMIGLSFMVESMLEVQAGTIFFAFCVGLFGQPSQNKKTDV